ncbi:MAG TPA: substrate-binding domain-containing protein [bacterium]|nr:substrate-binding domain-containing protein [bacterium]
MKHTAVATIVFCAALVLGCQDRSSGPSPEGGAKAPEAAAPVSGAKAPGRPYIIGFSQCTFEDPWRINMNQQMEEAAREHPEIKLVIANGENRNDKQIADVDNFMVRGVDALIISPREAAPLTAVVAKAHDRGIPVIVLDRRVIGDKYTCFIGASNLAIGRAAGEYLAQKLGGSGKIVEIEGILGATATQERHDGFREVMAKNPGLEIIYDQPGDYKRSPAKQIMDNALQAFPQIDAVYAHNDEMAIGAFLAAKAVGREKDMVIVGIDGQGEAVKMIRAGDLSATFVYQNGSKEAIETALKILSGEQAPKEIALEAIRITRDEHPEYQGF